MHTVLLVSSHWVSLPLAIGYCRISKDSILRHKIRFSGLFPFLLKNLIMSVPWSRACSIWGTSTTVFWTGGRDMLPSFQLGAATKRCGTTVKMTPQTQYWARTLPSKLKPDINSAYFSQLIARVPPFLPDPAFDALQQREHALNGAFLLVVCKKMVSMMDVVVRVHRLFCNLAGV